MSDSTSLGELRYAVYCLTVDNYVKRTDEEWYERLWELLDPVIDARAHRALGTDVQPATQWVGSSTTTPLPHVDTSEFEDPDNG